MLSGGALSFVNGFKIIISAYITYIKNKLLGFRKHRRQDNWRDRWRPCGSNIYYIQPSLINGTVNLLFYNNHLI